MRWIFIFGLLFSLFVIVLLFLYWVLPLDTLEFTLGEANSNFSLINSAFGMQFYENLRFPSSTISYKIFECPLKKTNDMQDAFSILQGLSMLEFYPVDSSPEISVGCDSSAKIQGGMFIAGEGGPTNISQAGEFNVILNGEILLREDSKCENPNVAIHELLHVLGFEHSSNRNNIMYNFSNCKQTIGDDIINLINDLYSVPSYPDLIMTNASAVMNGRYLSLNATIMNFGLKVSGASKLAVLADDKVIKEVEVDGIDVGYGRTLMLKNIFVSQLSVDELKLSIEYLFDELSKDNNIILLKIKK